jgi:membrane protein YqaA with SNARE-associated domain
MRKQPFAIMTRFAGRRGYSLLVASLALLDAFVLFVPNEALLVSAVLARREHWLRIAAWVSVGSALGAALFGFLCSRYGSALVSLLFPSLLSSKGWTHSAHFIRHHAIWGLALISLSPLPQHAAVAIAGLAHISVKRIFFSVLLGRSLKYFLVAWLCQHTSHLWKREKNEKKFLCAPSKA